MIPRDRRNRLMNYTRNFLDLEIKRIEELLKSKNIDITSSAMLSILLKKYKRDLEVIERELDELDKIKREWM